MAKVSTSDLTDATLGQPGKRKKRGGKKGRKFNRNRAKCKLYRARVGKPNKLGNKRGRNKIRA